MNLLSQFIYLFLILALTWRGSHCTCVFDSDFGFKLNCAFKKSSIFRVRNLGGVKGYVGLGFSVGDELGFGQSLSNLEGNKRRSLSSANSALAANEATSNNISKKQDRSSKNAIRSPSNLRSSTQLATVPPFKPIALEDNSTPLKPIVVPGYVVGPIDKSKKGFQVVQAPKFGGNAPVPQFAALPASISNRISSSSSVKAPMAFKNALQQATNNFQTPSTINASKLAHRTPTHSSLTDGPQVLNVVQIDRSSSSSSKVLPTAIPVSNAISDSEKPTTEKLNSNAMSETIKTLAHASNVSEDAIAAAINIRQQQLMQQQTKPKIATTTTERTTTEVIRKYPLAGPSKVMNAPKEYYPVGYDKNFDDNFVSRVELPDTSFYCGEQKHFPGLYGDEDLGCMVFHVCAFTDDGLIMKSFLCPESTLFDQSILKCNWWFYVDCKTSKKLYDSNIPISKSYQLMKALAFFSTYNKQT